MIRKRELNLQDRLYQGLGVVALVTQLLWLFTPLRWHNSGIPLVVSWSVLVGWSVVRLVRRLARETKVTASVLMGAAAGYLLLGLTAGLVMMGLETIQPGVLSRSNWPLAPAPLMPACWHPSECSLSSITSPSSASPRWGLATSSRCCPWPECCR